MGNVCFMRGGDFRRLRLIPVDMPVFKYFKRSESK